MSFFMFPFGFFSWIIPIIIIVLGIRIVRRISHSSYHRNRWDELDWEDYYRNYGEQSIMTGPSSTHSIESEIFKLAYKMKGKITVSEVVLETGLTIKEAEERMKELTDGIHVRMEVTDNGIVIYEFPEILARFEDREDKK